MAGRMISPGEIWFGLAAHTAVVVANPHAFAALRAILGWERRARAWYHIDGGLVAGE